MVIRDPQTALYEKMAAEQKERTRRGKRLWHISPRR